MLNPINSLYYQYFWWQRRHGHKDIAVYTALIFLCLCISINIQSSLQLIFYFSNFQDSTIQNYLTDGIVVAIISYIIFVIIIKRRYRIIIRDYKYESIYQSIFAILFAIYSLFSTLFVLWVMMSFDNKLF